MQKKHTSPLKKTLHCWSWYIHFKSLNIFLAFYAKLFLFIYANQGEFYISTIVSFIIIQMTRENR